MAHNIRPLSFAEILDRAFAVLRDNFSLIVGISAIVWIPYGVVLALGRLAPDPTLRAVIAIVAELALIFAAPIIGIAITTAVARVYLDRPATISDAYRSSGPIVARAVGTYFLAGVLLFLAFVALIVPGIYFMTCWALIVPVMIIEHRFGVGALHRSRELVNGAWWRTFGIVLAAGLITQVPAAAFGFLWMYIPFLGPILNAATLAVTSTYSGVVFVIYYFDRRCRSEDFDLRLLAEQVRSEIGTGTRAVTGTSPVA